MVFLNGTTVKGAKQQIDEVRALAKAEGRTVKFGVNGFVIQGADRTESARAARGDRRWRRSRDHAGLRRPGEGGASTAERIGMWADSSHANLVQPNDGFKTRLLGRPELIAERIRAYESGSA
nr:LLM class flavin-dependent oxidoreductase [Bradyrhizobium uaiense]